MLIWITRDINLVRFVLKFYVHDYSTKNIRIFYTGKDSQGLDTPEVLQSRHRIHARRPDVDDEIVEVRLGPWSKPHVFIWCV